MPLRSAGLGLKLNLYLLLLFAVLGAATSAILVYGFNRTQDNATQRSQEALEELGRLTLSAAAGGGAEQGGLQFESASEIGQQAANYMESFGQVGATTPGIDSSALARTDAGLYYDPDPSRTSDLLIWSYVALDDAPVQDELAYSAPLDAIFDTLFRSFADEVGGRNFDPDVIAFFGVNGVNRYYPPRGLHELALGDRDVAPLFQRVGPMANPERQTIWTAPYQDSAGQGLVVTAESPVYEGDVLRGAMQVDLLIDRLVDEINDIRPTPGGFAFYVDVDGDLFLTEAYDLLTREASDNAEFAAVLDGMRAGRGVEGVTLSDLETGVVVDLEGEAFIIAYFPLPSLGGSFAVAAPVSEITAAAAAITAGIDEEGNRTFLAILAAMGALFLLALVGAGYLNRQILLQPIGELLQGARAVGSGDLDTAIPVRSSDELGTLAGAFNSMVGEVRARGAELEQEVSERQQAQGELSALFAAMDDLVVVFDGDGRGVRQARTSPSALTAAVGNVEGRSLPEFMPPDQAELVVLPRKVVHRREAGTAPPTPPCGRR